MQQDQQALLSQCLLAINTAGTTWGLLLQLDVFLWEQDWRWHCERNFKLTFGNGVLDLFFIDTNPGISEYQTAVFANNTGEQLACACPQLCIGSSDFVRNCHYAQLFGLFSLLSGLSMS